MDLVRVQKCRRGRTFQIAVQQGKVSAFGLYAVSDFAYVLPQNEESTFESLSTADKKVSHPCDYGRRKPNQKTSVDQTRVQRL